MNSIASRSRARGVRRKKGEQGFALLIVLVFAAIIAISLYKELPIVVFEAQRQKEQLLIDRGGEYARGVKLYVRKVGQYPPSFEAMENTNRMRFLRQRYKDPFTGKDDWRLLHAGPGGIVIDSKVNPVSNPNGANGGNALGTANGNSPGNTGFSAANANSGFGGFNNNATSGNSAFGGGGGFGSGQVGNTNNNGQPNTGNTNAGGFGGFNSGNTNASNTSSGNTNSGSTNSNRSFGGYFSSVGVSADPETARAPSGAAMRQRAAAISANGAAGGTPASIMDANGNPSFNPAATGQNFAIPGNGDPNSVGPGGPGAQLTAGQNAGFNGAPTPGGNGQLGNPFNNRTAPTPNSQTGLNAPSSSSGLGVLQSGGIAGVASKAVGNSIKNVNDQERYSLWEFVYDASKDANRQMASALAQTGAGTNPVGNTGFTNGQSGFGQGAGTGAQGSPFGNSQSGFGGNSSNNGFGNSNSNGFGNSNNNGFGNSNNNGFGNSNNNGFGNPTNNNSSGFNNSTQGMPPPAIVRP